MLKIVHTLQEVDFWQLMQVYSQSNQENGQERYPHLPLPQQLLLAEQEFYSFLRDFFCEPTAFYAIWEHDARYVSALRMEKYRDGLLLEALETAPDARCNGYAAQLIRETLQYLSQVGHKKVYSHVNKTNKASLAVHTACGFERILEHAVYVDGSVLHNSCTMCYCLESDLP